MKVLGIVLLFSSAALAQTATGSLSGGVSDESGAVIPGVNVTVTNVDKGISSSLPTDASGAFELPPVGCYGNLGRNTLIGPGFVNVDLTLVKIIPVTERLKIDFRAEFFNLLNRAQFAPPDYVTFLGSGQPRGAAGRIQETLATSRQIQFGLKILF